MFKSEIACKMATASAFTIRLSSSTQEEPNQDVWERLEEQTTETAPDPESPEGSFLANCKLAYSPYIRTYIALAIAYYNPYVCLL